VVRLPFPIGVFAKPRCPLTAKLGIINLLSTLQPEVVSAIQHLLAKSVLPEHGDLCLQVALDILKALVRILEVVDLRTSLSESLLIHYSLTAVAVRVLVGI